MNLSYALLGFTVLTCLFTRHRNFMLLAILATTMASFFQGIVNSIGLVSLLGFSAICYSYFSCETLNKYVKSILFVIISILAACFMMHKIPGFSNALVIDNVHLSPLSSPFSMYLNFDKTIVALILYATSNLCVTEKFIDKKSILQTLTSLLLCAGVLLILGLLSEYIQFDPKMPHILWLWVFNNLLFVAVVEEIVFRGFLQKSLKSFLSPKATHLHLHLHLIIASMLFGLFHFKGGVVYIILALIAGGFYGHTYEKTNRILCATLVHFGLNFIHFLLFTYPALLLIP